LTVPGAVLWYYYSATDGVGTTSTHPSDAPDAYYEYSLLPTRLPASREDILLVDKHGRRVPGETRGYAHTSEYYHREALDILGYEYDVYDVEVPSGTTMQSNGPDTSMYKYYDTQVWWCADFDKRKLLCFCYVLRLTISNTSFLTMTVEKTLGITTKTINAEVDRVKAERVRCASADWH
jgi:hypothetical protein